MAFVLVDSRLVTARLEVFVLVAVGLVAVAEGVC